MSAWSEAVYVIENIFNMVASFFSDSETDYFVPTKNNTDTIKADVENNTSGLPAIKTAVDTADGRLTSATDGLGAIKTAVDNANGTLGNGTYGLAAIKTAVDAIGSGGGGSVIKSIQHVDVPALENAYYTNPRTDDFTISAVDVNKTIVLGNNTPSYYSPMASSVCYGYLTSATNLHVNYYQNGNYLFRPRARYTIVEFN